MEQSIEEPFKKTKTMSLQIVLARWLAAILDGAGDKCLLGIESYTMPKGRKLHVWDFDSGNFRTRLY